MSGGGFVWRGLRVAVTGRTARLRRVELERRLRAAGARPAARVTRRTAVLIVGAGGWPLLRDGRPTLALRRAEAVLGRGGRIEIMPERRALTLLGVGGAAEPDAQQAAMDADRVAELLGVDGGALRLWVRLGLVTPDAAGRFGFADIAGVRALAELVRVGVPLPEIVRGLSRLERVLPGVRAPVAQLRALGAGDVLVASLDGVLLDDRGQLVLDFEQDAREGAAGALRLAADPGRLETMIARAERLDDAGAHADAADAWAAALGLDPDDAVLAFNLGNALRDAGRGGDAAGAFETACGLDPGFAAAWYNLGDVLDDLGRADDAAGALERALAADPGFADAAFNLACLHEASGRHDDAERCWRRYVALTHPGGGEAAGEARRCLARCVARRGGAGGVA